MKETQYIACRIPVRLRILVQEYLKLRIHLNESDFLRDAIREKISRDAPQLYAKLFGKETNTEPLRATKQDRGSANTPNRRCLKFGGENDCQ